MRLSTLARITLFLAFVAPPLVPATRPAGPPPASLRYQAPVPGALYVMPPTALAWRLEAVLDPDTLTPALFAIIGLTSGVHTGTTHVALDGRTAIFDPDDNFTAGETVSVTVQAGLATQAGAVWAGTTYTFTISTAGTALSAAASLAGLTAEMRAAPNANAAARLPAQTTVSRTVDPANYVTLPADMPTYTVSGTLSGPVTDTYALGLLTWVGNAHVIPSHLLLVDGTGEPVYHQTMPLGGWGGIDFKLQPNGWLSYWSELDHRYHLLDNTYTEVDSLGAGNGYLADLHELQLLPNGEALLMIYDNQPMDMSQVITGGHANATVIGLVIQSIDPANDVVFEWRSWDHFLITETTASLTAVNVDYVHGNALELDNDGNLLVSSRHLDEITKINRDTAAVMWRMGGPRNEFTFINDPNGGWYHQHDIRRLANGDISLFDNHNPGPFSRGVVYTLDEISKTATLVAQDRHTPDVYGFAMGSYTVRGDGGRLVGWGAGLTTMTEFSAADSTRLEIAVAASHRSYRVARFPWVGAPAWPPTLVLTDTLTAAAGLVATTSQTLYFSWNGATEVGSYEVYAGFGPQTTTLLTTVPRTGFEDHVRLADLAAPANTCAYRVRALDHADQPLAYSNVVYVGQPCPVARSFLPVILHNSPAALGWWALGH